MFVSRQLALRAGGMLVGSVLACGSAGAGPATYNWTGLYLGATASMSGGEFTQVWSDPMGSYATDHAFASGFSGGGEVGLNLQSPGSHYVLGIEADIQDSTLKGTYDDRGPEFHAGTAVDWWGTVRGRAGYAFNQFLPFVTGGLAYGHLTNSYTDLSAYPTAYDETWSSVRVGWTLGAGMEVAVSQNLTVKAEYLYTDLAWTSVDPTDATLYGNDIKNAVSAGFSTARIGLNWKFN